MSPITRLYYRLTAHLPRKLPRTQAEFQKLRDIMVSAYSCNDQPSTTMVLAGQVTSTEAHRIRKSYAHIANCIKRLEINAVAQEFRQIAIKENNDRLEAAAKKIADAMKAEEESSDKTAEELPETYGQPQPTGAHEPCPEQSSETAVPSVC